MKDNNILPQSLILENRVGIRRGIFLLLLLFLFILLPWLSSQRELFRHEGLFAAIAAEYADEVFDPAHGVCVSAHHQLLSDAWPLYPAMVSLFYRVLPMESALRLVSVIMLGVLSLISGISASFRCGKRAGLVAAVCCFGTLFALDKGINGGPEVMAAVFLLTAQLLFFHYGSRCADWNSAWLASAVFLALGFLTAGPVVILFFAFPLVFLRRPLSFGGKFRYPGFIFGVILLIAVVLIWLSPLGLDWRHYAKGSEVELFPVVDYLLDLLAFPAVFIVRMMPWGLIMWLPFCVALQAISPVPEFSRYLRTLFFSMLALIWLVPGISSMLIFFVIGPLAILTGINYDLGVRRYGTVLRRILLICGAFFPLAVLALMLILFLPESYIGFFGESAKMQFRLVPGYLYFALTGIAILALLGGMFGYGLRRFPIWVQVLLISFGIGTVATVELLPYRMMEKDWSSFGRDVRKVLPEGTEKIYKYAIDGMYCGLFYTGKPVYTLENLQQLDQLEDTVYLISSTVPVYPDRVWTPLLPENYTCRGVEVCVWRGEIPADEEDMRDEYDE